MTTSPTTSVCPSRDVHPPHPVDDHRECPGLMREATATEIAQARAYAEDAVGWKPGDDGSTAAADELVEWERNVQHEYEGALEVLIHANGGRYAESASERIQRARRRLRARIVACAQLLDEPFSDQPDLSRWKLLSRDLAALDEALMGVAAPASAPDDPLVTAVLNAAIVLRQDPNATHTAGLSAHERELFAAVDLMLAARHNLRDQTEPATVPGLDWHGLRTTIEHAITARIRSAWAVFEEDVVYAEQVAAEAASAALSVPLLAQIAARYAPEVTPVALAGTADASWSWTPPTEPGPHVRRVRPVERYPGDNGIWFDREPDGSGWRLVVNNRRGDAALEWLQVVAAAGQVYGGRKLIDATAERRCYGLTEAQVDQFVTAECGRRDVHNGHQGVGGTHA